MIKDYLKQFEDYSEKMTKELETLEKWKRPTPDSFNMTITKDGWWLSYNASPHLNCDNKPELAICYDNEFYILLGDFRKEFEDLNLKEALTKFIEYADDYIGFWSASKNMAIDTLNKLEE